MKLYFDIDTQIDFLFPAGALYVPGAEKLLPLIATLNRSASASGAKVISTMCSHDENDAEFKQWPPHCVAGTVGQAKPCALLLEKRCVVPNERPWRALACSVLPQNGQRPWRQVRTSLSNQTTQARGCVTNGRKAPKKASGPYWTCSDRRRHTGEDSLLPETMDARP